MGNHQKFFVLLAALLLTSSCATLPSSPTITSHRKSEAIYAIRLFSNDTIRFSGLLALHWSMGTQNVTLLDASGIRLLEFTQRLREDVVINGGIPKLKKSQLAQILAKSLRRIYSIEPAILPCSTHGVLRICRQEKEDGGWVKYSRMGVIPLWKASYLPSQNPQFTYRQPWLGLRIILTPLGQATKDGEH